MWPRRGRSSSSSDWAPGRRPLPGGQARPAPSPRCRHGRRQAFPRRVQRAAERRRARPARAARRGTRSPLRPPSCGTRCLVAPNQRSLKPRSSPPARVARISTSRGASARSSSGVPARNGNFRSDRARSACCRAARGQSLPVRGSIVKWPPIGRDRDIGLVQAPDQLHVTEDGRVASEVELRPVLDLDHEAAGSPSSPCLVVDGCSSSGLRVGER